MSTAQTEALVEKLFQAMIGFQEVAGLYLGEKLGLYQSLHDDGPATSTALSARTGTDERYVREWLEQQAVSGILTVDDAGGVWSSTDGGQSFQLEITATVGLTSVALTQDGGWALATGRQGRALQQAPGSSWQELSLATVDLEAALVSHDDQRFYAAGQTGVLVVSHDHMESWSTPETHSTMTLNGLEDLAMR